MSSEPVAWFAPVLSHEGEVWEVGTHRGVHAARVADLITQSGTPHTLRCFDTFAGRPEETVEDGTCGSTQFADTSLEHVARRLAPYPFVVLHPGVVPATFAGLESARILCAYVDLDLYAGTRGTLDFILPRLEPGGVIVVDDYLARPWLGVSIAVDETPRPWQHVGARAIWVNA